MSRMRAGWLAILLAGFLVASCDDDSGPGTSDGIGGDVAVADGGVDVPQQQDGPAADVALDVALDVPQVLDVGPDSFVWQDGSGWVIYDGGPVQIYDGAVIITDDAGNTMICYPTSCAGKFLECGNCIDDDGDGLVDWKDPECLGPCDNTEGPGLESGVGGTTGTSCGVDCYFDYGNGPGNDDCVWDHRCDPLEPELPTCPYDPTMVGGNKCPSVQSQQCTDFCLPFTPNGCDCWGCCTFPALAGKGDGGSDGYVWIGAMDSSNVSTCTLADVTDPTKCPPCTPVAGCFNPCGKCEVCVGKPLPPPECYQQPDAGPPTDGPVGDGPKSDAVLPDSGPPSRQCPPGQQPCGLPGQAPCPPSYYCISGCCVFADIS
jgi:hypothetical protein